MRKRSSRSKPVLEVEEDDDIQEHYPEASISQNEENSVVDLCEESMEPEDEEEIEGSILTEENNGHESDEGMSSIPESESRIEDENSNPQNSEDPELLFFIKNGRFEDELVVAKELPERLVDNFQSQDYTVNEITKIINAEVNKMTARTDKEKDSLKSALKEVLLEDKPRKEVIESNQINWSLFTVTISRIYDKLEISNFGAKDKIIPEFELNLLEICLDKGENAVKSNDPNVTDSGPVKKKFKSSMDASTSSASHATFNRRLGDCVPEHWRTKNTDLVKFCIRKSVDLTMSLKSDRNDIEGTLNKCRAIENVILNNGNAKTAAINYGINYSTLHNYTHRAMVTIAKVLGDNEIPEKTVQLLKKNTQFEEICKAMDVKRAPTLARFVKADQKEQ